MGTTPTVNPNLTGVAPNLTAVTAADSFANNGQVILHVHNGNAGTVTVTVDDPNSVTPTAATAWNPDVVITIPTGTDKYLGPFPVSRFNDVNGNVNVTYSPTSSVTAEVIDAA